MLGDVMHAETHPRAEDLAAFAQGRLSLAESTTIEEHVLACEPCSRLLQEQPDDPLLLLVRQTAASDGTVPPSGRETAVPPEESGLPVPPGDLAETRPPVPVLSAEADILAELPEGLRSHTRYHILRRLGEGGMGAVYQAEHRVMRRPVALKVIKPKYTANAAAVERFQREVRAAARLAHPNIVTAHDAEHVGETHFLVMEFVEGLSLMRLLRERGPLPVAEACDYVRQAALGLQHAHERGMVHRDIKPDNLMRTADGTVKVLDFGLAALTAERESNRVLTEDRVLTGTPDYMAPEQAEAAHPADIRADIYSLGCTLYHLLTGTVPYPARTALLKILAHREQPLPALRQARPEVPPELAAVVARMLAKKPEQRYQT